jgi:hypothetical protein
VSSVGLAQQGWSRCWQRFSWCDWKPQHRSRNKAASLSSSPFVPFTRVTNSYSKTGRLVLLTDLGRLEMGKSRDSDWPAVFFLLSLVGALLTAFTPSPAKGQQPPLREGCRAVSKLEYDTAKREYILISKGGRYVQTGHFWRRNYWWCHV